MGKNNRNERKAKQARHKVALSGMKDQRNRWAKEVLRKQRNYERVPNDQ